MGAENRRLREGDPAASEHVDVESELQQTRDIIVELTERVGQLTAFNARITVLSTLWKRSPTACGVSSEPRKDQEIDTSA